EALATSAIGVYAIGDIVAGPMLAHKASAEGVALAETLAGHEMPALRHELIPQAIFTDPEIASVGLSESAAREAGHEILVGRFPYAALGKALGMREPDGFFQVVAGGSLGLDLRGGDRLERQACLHGDRRRRSPAPHATGGFEGSSGERARQSNSHRQSVAVP
ncbi:hypothetical protein ACFLSF_04980, partial [Candidatus Bipolaricaulota bacterium]